MFFKTKKHLPVLIVVAVFAALVAGPALSHDADGGGHDSFAHSAGSASKVDGKSAVGFGATTAQRKGKLVATSGTTGRLPADILGPIDADKIDGQDAADFYSTGSKVADSELLDGLDSEDVVPDSGVIFVSTLGTWQTLSPSTSLTTINPGSLTYTRSAAGDSVLHLFPEMPSALYGESLRINGVHYCYDANDGNVVLSRVDLRSISTGDNGSQTIPASATDDTDRNDHACRILTTTGNTIMSVGTNIQLELKFTTTAAAMFHIQSTTFVLESTNIGQSDPTL